MFQRQQRPDPYSMPRQSPDECRHLYMQRSEGSGATCIHCGMQFNLAWSADRRSITFPTIRNTAIMAVSGGLLAAFALLGVTPLAYVFLMVMVLFFTRVLLGGMEMFGHHGFVPGRLGPLIKRPFWNVLIPKPYLVDVGRVRFPIDKDAYDHFKVSDTVLVEHLRWSRLPVAIYQGHLPSG